ncbi:hypothetical protein B0H13DRAFT_1850721 [Mycena leptocephala]|nr:hypothetical protein B0H13DRAFT_1850721 [Mycena leptocephala]
MRTRPDVVYNTRVERVDKRYDGTRDHGWTLMLKRLERTGSHSGQAAWWTELQDFDAIVVATGRCNAPHIPSIAGLEEWASKFPESIIHSRQYRYPQPFTDERILVVGGAVSQSHYERHPSADCDLEITREINPTARKIYQSVRGSPPSRPHVPYDAANMHLDRLPANVSVVPEIRRFHASNASIELVNGTFLQGIGRVVFATGFRYSFPFLPQFHNSSGSRSPHPIVTDGTHLRDSNRCCP